MTQVETIQWRQQCNHAVRSFLLERGYAEVETPRFVASPDIDPTLSHFTADLHVHGGGSHRGAFITSPEYALKKLVSDFMPRLFELARVFRNQEPLDAWHNPEFTLLEWYRLGGTLEDGIEETIELIVSIVKVLSGSNEVRVGERTISLDRANWRIATVEELLHEHAGVESLREPSVDFYREALGRHDLSWGETDTISDLFQRLFLNRVEPVLRKSDQPIVVRDYPAHEATLARISDKGFAERFEIYVGGVELCNAYGELTDAAEQRARFEAELQERKRLGKEAFPIDEDLLQALDQIDGPLFGNALGIDRLIMLAVGAKSIEDVILFPTKTLFQP